MRRGYSGRTSILVGRDPPSQPHSRLGDGNAAGTTDVPSAPAFIYHLSFSHYHFLECRSARGTYAIHANLLESVLMKSETCCGYDMEFAETTAELRTLYGAPSELASRKSMTKLDGHCRAFIARSPFVCVSTAADDGTADVSPRGDAPGFVSVVDDHTLLIPDRLGNNRIDSLTNIVRNPNVGLLFLVPGVDETLRVNGAARIVLKSELLDQLAVGGKVPRTGILFEVREAFLQCAKALKRSRLWTGEYAIAREELATLGKMLVDQIGLTTSVDELDEAIDKAYREKLY